MVSVITEEGAIFAKNNFPIYPQVSRTKKKNNPRLTYKLFMRNLNFILPEIHLPSKLKSNFIPTGPWPHEIPKFISSREIPFHILTHTETINYKTQEGNNSSREIDFPSQKRNFLRPGRYNTSAADYFPIILQLLPRIKFHHCSLQRLSYVT